MRERDYHICICYIHIKSHSLFAPPNIIFPTTTLRYIAQVPFCCCMNCYGMTQSDTLNNFFGVNETFKYTSINPHHHLMLAGNNNSCCVQFVLTHCQLNYAIMIFANIIIIFDSSRFSLARYLGIESAYFDTFQHHFAVICVDSNAREQNKQERKKI